MRAWTRPAGSFTGKWIVTHVRRLQARAIPLLLFLVLFGAGCGEAGPGEAPGDAVSAGEGSGQDISSGGTSAPSGPVPPDATTPAAETVRVELVDTAIAPAVAGEDGWGYVVRAQADLDEDGVEEAVVLTARAEIHRGRPAWDDGQPWQVYVEEPDGTRTYLYSRYVQLGTVTMRIGLEEPSRRPSVVLLEHLPDRLSLYEIEYLAPDRTTAHVRFRRQVDPRGDAASPIFP